MATIPSADRPLSAQGPSSPGYALVYASTIGQAGLPWLRSNAQLNQPWGIGSDREGLWIANAAGRNLLRFGAGTLEELGRAGSLDALYGRPLRFPSDLSVVVHETLPAGQNDFPRRTIWLADQAGHVALGLALDNAGRPGLLRVLGETDRPGADPDHFRNPTGVAADALGRVYVSDTGNHRVQVFGADGSYLTTIGQTGSPGAGPGQLDRPARLALSSEGRLYIADSGNHRVVAYDVREPARPVEVQTYGQAGVAGAGPDAFREPLGLAVDATFLYVADSGNRRVQILQWRSGRHFASLDGKSAAGCGRPGGPDWGLISDVDLDQSGNLYLSMPLRMRVQGCDAAKRSPRSDLSFGSLDLPYRSREDLHNAPGGLALAADGSLAVVEREGQRIVRYRPDGAVEWTAGQAGLPGREPLGSAAALRFDQPTEAVFFPDGRLLVSDSGNGRLLVLKPSGVLDALWGEGALEAPAGLALLPDGSLAVADRLAGRVRLLDGSGQITGDLSGPGGAIDFEQPADVAVDALGNWFVSEPASHRVRVFDRAGRPLREIGRAGLPGADFEALNRPTGLALDADGRLLVVDTGNHRLQVFAPDGSYLSTVGGRRGTGTGGFIEPEAVAVGADGRVYVADTYGHRIQVFAPAEAPWLPAARKGLAARHLNAFESLAEKDGRLYAGLRSGSLGLEGQTSPAGAEIWRRDGDADWEPIVSGGSGDPANRGITALWNFGGQLYAGVENLNESLDPASGRILETSAGGQIWRSRDGERWETVASGGLGDAGQSGLGPFAEFQGQLYAASRSIDPLSPPQLWTSATGSPGSWQRIRIDLASRGQWQRNGGISAMGVYSGSLYVGTCATDFAQLWQTADGKQWRAAAQLAPGADPRDALPQLGEGAPCVTDIEAYEGRLYVALGTDGRMGSRLGIESDALPSRSKHAGRPAPPVELWRCLRCEGQDWEAAAAAGFGKDQNRGVLSLEPFDEATFRYLYAVVGNASSGMEAWRADDGLDWEMVASGGFGDDNNVDPGSAAVRVYRNRLYAGSLNRVQGGELWSTGGTRPGILPTVPGPSPTPTPRPSPQPPTGRARYRKVDAWPLTEAGQSDRIGQPVDIALAADGSAYILDASPSRVLHLGADDRWGSSFGGLGSGPERIARAGAIALDEAAGRVYVSDLGTRRLIVFDRQGNYLQTLLDDLEAADILVLPDSTLWLADDRSGALRHVAVDGRELERFGRYARYGDDGFDGFVGLVEEAGARLWVADQAGLRLRAYDRDAAGARLLARSLVLGAGNLAACDATRLQALPGPALLVGSCVIENGQLLDRLPEQHRGSDLTQVGLRTAHPGGRQFLALATYDTDPMDASNPTAPALVRYFDMGFDIVTGYALGRSDAVGPPGDLSLDGPFRLDLLPGGDLVVMDEAARREDPIPPGYFRRFAPDGRLVEKLAVRSYPSQSYRLMLDADLTLATGDPGQMIGIGQLRYGSPRQPSNFEIASLARTVKRRFCSGGSCFWGEYAEPIWQTTLIYLDQDRAAQDYNYAATIEHTRRQYVLLQLWADNPTGLDMPARLYFFGLDGRGRKTEIPLEGSEREALWSDLDAATDGHIYVLDTLNDRVLVLDSAGKALRSLDTPKDAWKVAGGPNGEVFLLTTYGQVVRLAADGSLLSRFSGLPNDIVPPTALSDLAVDAWGRVYTIDTLYNQVSVFEPEGSEDDVLEGERCSLAGDKWVAPDEILLGETAELHLALFGSCGFVEDPSDIVLMVNARSAKDLDYPWQLQESVNLRVARQIFSVVDLDRHRLGLGSFVLSGRIEEALSQDRSRLIRAFYDVPGRRTPTDCPRSNTEVALRTAREIFEESPPGRRKVLVLIRPDFESGQYCPWSAESVGRLAANLQAEGITIVSVNGNTAACSSATNCGIPVADRGQGVGRPAIYHALSRRWPANLVQTGSLVDTLPANIDYVAGSADPPALWDPAARSLTWTLDRLPLGPAARFRFTIRPRNEGLWPSNVEALAEAVDGWGQPQRVLLPIPKIRVYGELPPTPTFTPSVTPTPSPTPPPSATLSPEPTPTSEPGTVYLPILLWMEPCRPDTRSADVALVIDTSGSMAEVTSPGGPSKLDAARNAAASFLAQMNQGRDQAALVQFHHQATVLAPLTGDIGAVSQALDRLEQASGTRIDLALEAALAELRGPARRPGNNQVLILLTDGEPTGTTAADVLAAADRAKAAGILIFSIGLGQQLDPLLLQALASRTDWYYSAPDSSDLEAIYTRIAYEIPCRPSWP